MGWKVWTVVAAIATAAVFQGAYLVTSPKTKNNTIELGIPTLGKPHDQAAVRPLLSQTFRQMFPASADAALSRPYPPQHRQQSAAEPKLWLAAPPADLRQRVPRGSSKHHQLLRTLQTEFALPNISLQGKPLTVAQQRFAYTNHYHRHLQRHMSTAQFYSLAKRLGLGYSGHASSLELVDVRRINAAAQRLAKLHTSL